jgi:hypothetical protein
MEAGPGVDSLTGISNDIDRDGVFHLRQTPQLDSVVTRSVRLPETPDRPDGHPDVFPPAKAQSALLRRTEGSGALAASAAASFSRLTSSQISSR